MNMILMTVHWYRQGQTGSSYQLPNVSENVVHSCAHHNTVYGPSSSELPGILLGNPYFCTSRNQELRSRNPDLRCLQVPMKDQGPQTPTTTLCKGDPQSISAGFKQEFVRETESRTQHLSVGIYWIKNAFYITLCTFKFEKNSEKYLETYWSTSSLSDSPVFQLQIS